MAKASRGLKKPKTRNIDLVKKMFVMGLNSANLASWIRFSALQYSQT